MSESIEQFALRVADQTPAPAGGSVAAITAALASALPAMIARIALGRQPDDPSLTQMVEQGDSLRQRLLALADEDANAYLAVLEARRDHSGGEAARDERIRKAWRHAVQVPADVIRLAAEVAKLARRAAKDGPPSTLGDAVMAALLASAAAAGSLVNLRLNAQAAGRPVDLRILEDDMAVVLREAQKAAVEARQIVEEKLTAVK